MHRQPSRTIDPAAEELLVELAPKVQRWLFHTVGPRGDLDDLTQEALVQIAQALDRFRGECSVETYARRIAVRVALRQLKHGRRDVPPLRAVQDAADTRDPERIASSRESLRALFAALDQLHESRRLAFTLCAIEGLAHEEAAEILDISVNTLRQRLKRARADLAEKLRRDPALAPLFGRTR